jgi:ribonucleoside-diphosphate reductase beta chain
MHCEFAYTIYKNKIVNKLPVAIVSEMVSDAVVIEKKFINESLKCGLIGMNPSLMSQYIEYVADVLLQNLDYPILYGSKQPFDFMDDFNLQIKSNFFEVRTTSYKKLSNEVVEDKVDEDDDF